MSIITKFFKNHPIISSITGGALLLASSPFDSSAKANPFYYGAQILLLGATLIGNYYLEKKGMDILQTDRNNNRIQNVVHSAIHIDHSNDFLIIHGVSLDPVECLEIVGTLASPIADREGLQKLAIKFGQNVNSLERLWENTLGDDRSLIEFRIQHFIQMVESEPSKRDLATALIASHLYT